MGEQRVKPKSEAEAMAEAEEMLKAIKDKSGESKEIKLEEKSVGDSGPESGGEKKPAAAGSIKKSLRKKKRSVRYQEAIKLVDKNKFYLLDEAIELVKKTSYAKFDASLEVHVRIKSKKGQEGLRGLLEMPHGTGREPKIAIVDEAMIEKIAKENKTSFDILLATPAMMPKLAKIAKILGPQGKMPNPKSGTVTADPQKTIQEIKKGKVEYKTDQYGNIHQVIGKVSWDAKKLQENLQSLLAVLPQVRLQSVTLCATMGPGIKVKI